MRYILPLFVIAALTGCASMNFGWYKPGGSQQEFAEDKYECMSKSQMEASGAYVNAYGGAASSQTTTNLPLFQACMQAGGYAWTSQAEVERHEAAQRPQTTYSQGTEQAGPYVQACSRSASAPFAARLAMCLK